MVRLLAIVLLLLAAGCAGGRRAGQADATRPIAEFEDFDPAPFETRAPSDTIAVEHDVPPALMSGRYITGAIPPRTAPGFRIQIVSTDDKANADQTLEAITRWWSVYREEPGVPKDLFPERLPTYIAYTQPYYRVRIGDFPNRQAAERALDYVKRRFLDAWIVPDTVLVGD